MSTALISREQHQQLAQYERMCQSIAAAHRVDEVKEIRNQAVALAAYCRQAQNTEAERLAIHIRLRAERRAGELLAEREKAKGARGNPGGRGAPVVRSPDGTTQTLADLGVTKKQSSVWQRLAKLPDEQFERRLAAVRIPSAAALVAERRQQEDEPEFHILLAVGRLKDVVRRAVECWPTPSLPNAAVILRELADEVEARCR